MFDWRNPTDPRDPADPRYILLIFHKKNKTLKIKKGVYAGGYRPLMPTALFSIFFKHPIRNQFLKNK